MKPELLFISNHEKISLLAKSNDEAELLSLAGLLRKMLFDQHALANTVNTRKVKILFHVGKFRDPQRSNSSAVAALEDGVDPATRAPGAPSTVLKQAKFPSHVVIVLDGRPVTIKDVVRYAANVAGGVHYDPNPADEYQVLHLFSDRLHIADMPLGIRQLKAIARVVLKALQPLYEDVKAHS